MGFMFKYAWVVFIVFTFINGFVLKYKSKKFIAKNPELKEGYDKLFKGFLFYGNIPWVIMMIGSLTGMTQNVFEYFSPRNMNPIVIVFHLSVIVLWILSIRWIYFKDGANFLEKHPGLINTTSLNSNSTVTAKQIKFFFPIMIISGIVAMVMMWIVDFPISDFSEIIK